MHKILGYVSIKQIPGRLSREVTRRKARRDKRKTYAMNVVEAKRREFLEDRHMQNCGREVKTS